MMAVGHADLRVAERAQLTRHHERGHSSQVALEREMHQVEHQHHMLFPVLWDSDRRRRCFDARFVALFLRLDDAPLDLADVVHVLGDACAITGSELQFQLVRTLHHRVEDAGVALQTGAALGWCRAVSAEHAFEYDARIDLHRQRL